MSLKIIFAGTPAFAAESLQALLKSDHKILSVYTQPDKPAGRGQRLTISPTKELALKHQIPIEQPTSLKDPAIYQKLHALNPDVFVVVAYGFLIPKTILTLPKYGCLNVHASLLPRWRGASPIQHALIASDQTTGISITQMDAGLDTGDILLTNTYSLRSDETSQTLHDRLATLGAKTLLDTLQQLENGKLSPTKQNNEKATYAPKILKTDAQINWQENAVQIQAKIRAFDPWPVAFTQLNDQNIRIWRAKPTDLKPSADPGVILTTDKTGITVATKEGCLTLLELQLPGGKRLSVQEILHSKSDLFQPGTQFGT